MFLEKVNGPRDVQKLNTDELKILAEEVRQALIFKLSHAGGHAGSNLGVVELTVALHHVFDSPNDKIIWDVSHQCYPHKILTGRKNAYLNPDEFGQVTGFTNPEESEHDLFTVGHTATSVSLALGMAKARDLCGGKEFVVAIIGDGALSGGEAYEALNYAGEYHKNIIIILNDNNQSIGENHGGLYKKLKELRDSNGTSSDNFFKGLNLDYRYLEDGHNIDQLVELFKEAKKIDHPIVLHIHTQKGKGFKYSEEFIEEWHSVGPFNVSDGQPKSGKPNYDMTIHDSIMDLFQRDDKAILLTAATPRAMGFVGQERAELIESGRIIDVGIAEENAMAISSGIAKYGTTAVFGAYGTFLQRTYDQLIHDVCLNNSPATILVFMPGAYGMKSNTHFSMCDIQMFSHVPNMIYLSPAYKEEYLAMFEYATAQKEHPIAIRVPNRFYLCGEEDKTDYGKMNKAKVMTYGEDVAIIAVGALIPKAMEIFEACENKYGKKITVINPIYLTGVDNELLDELKKNHKLVITMEDGILDGGYGQSIASYYGNSDMKVITLGISKEFHSNFDTEKLLSENGISVEQILNTISNLF